MPEGVMLHNLSPPREVCDSAEADHEYEILDKYSQAYEDVKAPPPKLEPELVNVQPQQPFSSKQELVNVQPQQPFSSNGDYDYTLCPAYVSVATANINQGETSHPSCMP